MPSPLDNFLADTVKEFRKHKDYADKATAQLGDADFFRRPADRANSIAVIVKHVAGNLRSRWTDFLTTDGEKPDRDRDNEFVVTPADTRESLRTAWEAGWSALFGALGGLTAADLARTVPIRGEPHTVTLAIVRSLAHTAYHVGQVVYLARLFKPDGWQWLTIPPGQSRQFNERMSQRQPGNGPKP
jgi:hypothetical protein